MTLHSSRGFTLMEVLVTVAIVGIAASVAIPSVASRTKTFDLAREGRQIHTDISRLRARAVAEQRTYEVVIEDGHAVRIQRREEAEEGVLGAVDAVQSDVDGIARTATVPEDATVELNGESEGTIVFEPTGRVSSGGDLVMEDGRRRVTIRVLASGMTRLYIEPVSDRTTARR